MTPRRTRVMNHFTKVVLSVAMAFTALSSCSGDDDVATGSNWSSFDLGPLESRNDPVVATIGTEVLVVGGNNFFCAPTDDCALPDEEPLDDGAMFDTETSQWRPVAAAPFGLDYAEATTIGSSVYVITQCDKHPSCPRGRAMIRYDVDDDAWVVLAEVPGKGYHHLLPVDGELFAVSTSNEQPGPDYRYDASSDSWDVLDAAPGPPLFDRFAVDVAGTLVMYGSPIEGEQQEKFVASYDLDAEVWTELGRAPSGGWQVFDIDDTIVLNPHFGAMEGGIHDVATDTWTPLPAAPSSDRWRGDIAGVIGAGTASYEYAQGWMLDLRSDSWVEVALPGSEASQASVIAVGDALFVVGGHHWTDGEVRVDGGVSLWKPPDGNVER